MKGQLSFRDIRQQAAPPAIAFERGKGHVSVNPVYGCRIGCPFCVGLADPWTALSTAGVRRRLASTGQILDSLEERADELRTLKLSLMDFADPFDPDLRPLLKDLLVGIDHRLPDQPVVLTTRLHPGRAFMDWLHERIGLPVSLFVSLGDAAGGVRPVTSVTRRLRLLTDSAGRGLHTAMLLRPLVREWTRWSALGELLRHAARTCDEVVLGGLQLSPQITTSLAVAGWPVPERPSDEHGGVAAGFRSEVVLAASVMAPDLPVSEHRSCAVNRHRGLPCQVAGSGLTQTSLRPQACVPGCGIDVQREQPHADRCWLDRAPAPSTEACAGFCRFDVRGADDHARDARGYCKLRCVA
jgi:DNA repair photolyase